MNNLQKFLCKCIINKENLNADEECATSIVISIFNMLLTPYEREECMAIVRNNSHLPSSILSARITSRFPHLSCLASLITAVDNESARTGIESNLELCCSYLGVNPKCTTTMAARFAATGEYCYTIYCGSVGHDKEYVFTASEGTIAYKAIRDRFNNAYLSVEFVRCDLCSEERDLRLFLENKNKPSVIVTLQK